MRNPAFLHWLIHTGATVLAITILSALGAAAFALICGAFAWVLRVEKMPIGFFWATASGAIAGFLMGTLWAIDQAMNRRHFLSFLPTDERRLSLPFTNGQASQETILDECLKKTAEVEAPAKETPLQSCPNQLASINCVNSRAFRVSGEDRSYHPSAEIE